MKRGARPAAAVLALLSAAALAACALWARAAPLGAWDDAVFGATLWNHSDPAGYYVPSAHQLSSTGGRLLYPGHPGLTLQLLLRGVQEAAWRLASPPGADFTAACASGLVRVFVWSKLACGLAHVLSFWLSFAFARRLLRGERAALLAAAAYATSLPVVYYLARVSVEPLMMDALLASFLLAWSAADAPGRGARGPALAAAAGAAAAAGLATKFHLLWPLPLAAASALLGAERRGRRLAAFAAGAAAVLLLSARLLDWRDFFAYWDVSGMGGGAASGAAGLLRRQWEVLAAALSGLRGLPARAWLPGPTRSGLYGLCEGPLLLLAAWGARVERRRRGAPRRAWAGPAAVGAYTLLIWAYRSFAVAKDLHGFHYLFVVTLLACVLAGAAGDDLLDRVPPRRRAAAAAAGLALLHAAPVLAAVSAFRRDAAQYARVRAFGDALEAAGPGGKVAVRGDAPPDLAGLLGLAVLRETPPTRSLLIDAVAASFVRAAPGRAPAGARAVVVVVGEPGRRVALGPFAPGAPR